VETVCDLLEYNARVYGQEVALIFGNQRLTYAQYVERGRRLGSALHRLGMRSQDRVSILGMNSQSYLEFYAACELSGYIAATVNFRLAPPEVQYIVADAAPKVLIFESQYTETIDRIRGQLPSVKHYVCIGTEVPQWAAGFEELVASGELAGAPLAPPSSNDVAYLIYTSGTTGRPKGCMLEHRAQMAQAQLITEFLQMSASTRTLLMMPFYHIGAKALQLAQARAGGEIHVQRAFDAAAVLNSIESEKITNLHLAPIMVQSLIEHPDIRRHDVSSVRSICYSAAPMPVPVLRRGLELFGSVFVQFWGQTEGSGTVLTAAAHRPNGSDKDLRRLGSIGHPYPEVRVRIVDDEDHDIPLGQPGEMLIQGPIVMRGYWNNSPASMEALRGGWLHTGDVCTLDEEGYLYLVDRKKDMIISGGENIYSREVEEAIIKLDAVLECAVFGVPHSKWGEAVCAAVVKRQGRELKEETIVAHCRTLIASYKRPRYVVFEADLPKLPSGKISKVELRQRYAATSALREIVT